MLNSIRCRKLQIKDMAESKEQVVSLEELDSYPEGTRINSPRSIEACNREGIDPEELVLRPKKYFHQKGITEKVLEMRYNFHLNKRREALASLKETRKEIIAKLSGAGRIKQSEFLSDVRELSQKKDNPQTKDGLNEILQKQTKENHRQLLFFEEAHRRHDSNLKKNMEYAIKCMKKREEIDRRREEELLTNWMKKEEEHELHKKINKEKTAAEFQKIRQKELEILDQKKKSLEILNKEIKDRAQERAQKILKSFERVKKLEKSQKATTERKEKILKHQEEVQQERARQTKAKLDQIENRNRVMSQEVVNRAKENRKRTEERVHSVLANYAIILRDEKKKVEDKLEKKSSSSRLESSMHFSQSSGTTADKVKQVQLQAIKNLENKRAAYDAKMEAFSRRQKQRDEKEKERKEEIKEQARQWTEKLQININKKKKKESYRKKLLERKIISLKEKADMFEKNKKLISQERFYAKINNDMKSYLVSEAIHQMSLHKNYSLKEIDEIMKNYETSIGDKTSEKEVLQQINKVLAGPRTTTHHSQSKISYRSTSQ